MSDPLVVAADCMRRAGRSGAFTVLPGLHYWRSAPIAALRSFLIGRVTRIIQYYFMEQGVVRQRSACSPGFFNAIFADDS
jgi:hypothetical protein